MVKLIRWKRFWINLGLVPIVLYPVWLVCGSLSWVKDSAGIFGNFMFLLLVLMPLMLVGGIVFNLILLLIPGRFLVSYFRALPFLLSWSIPIVASALGSQGKAFFEILPGAPFITAIALAVYTASLRLPVRDESSRPYQRL